MTLISMNVQAGILIIAIIILRALAITRLTKTTFVVLWDLVLLRLWVPYSFSSPLSFYSVINGLSTITRPNTISKSSVWTIIWGCGVTLLFLYFAAVYIRCHLIFASSKSIQNDFVNNWLSCHKLKRICLVQQSSSISSPLTYGFFRPVILMPQQTDWTDIQTLRTVMEHEYIHIRRFDSLIKIIFTATLCIHWFNPLVWIMFELSNRDIEISCDEQAIHSLGETNRVAYALALIKTEEQKNSVKQFCSFVSRNATEERIYVIMKTKNRTLISRFISIVIILGMGVVFTTHKNDLKLSSEFNVQYIQELEQGKHIEDFAPETAATSFLSSYENGQYVFSDFILKKDERTEQLYIAPKNQLSLRLIAHSVSTSNGGHYTIWDAEPAMYFDF